MKSAKEIFWFLTHSEKVTSPMNTFPNIPIMNSTPASIRKILSNTVNISTHKKIPDFEYYVSMINLYSSCYRIASIFDTYLHCFYCNSNLKQNLLGHSLTYTSGNLSAFVVIPILIQNDLLKYTVSYTFMKMLLFL